MADRRHGIATIVFLSFIERKLFYSEFNEQENVCTHCLFESEIFAQSIDLRLER